MKNAFLIIVFVSSFISALGQKNIDDYKIIGDSTNTFKSIDDILNIKELEGKVIYVDIWGTRCPPCIKQFEYLPDLKKRFENDPVIFLYLCSPYTTYWDKKNEKLWKELIVKHNLEGINILMSAECYEDGFFEKYKDKYSEDRMYGIPTYLLVNKHGEIINFDASRPSKKEILYNEIQALIDSN